ncbi:MAG: metalloregulator ArsR/SmtB family transcription factor [Arenimonas sp.]
MKNANPNPASGAALALMQAHAAEASALLKAMSNQQRLLILCQLAGCELSVGDLCTRLDLSQSALSQHLAVLRESELVKTRRAAQTIFYSLPDGPVQRVMETLYGIYCGEPRRTTAAW